jgi:hypothetical protein
MKVLTATTKLEGTEIIPLKKLYPSIRHAATGWKDYVAIKDDIEENGMRYPLMCWIVSPKEWNLVVDANHELLPVKHALLAPPFVYVVMCGNNRYAIARDLEYEEIEVWASTSREEVSHQCSKIRKDWNSRSQKQ